jgi:hypothetical protein
MTSVMDMVNGAREYENVAFRAFWQEMIGHLRGKPAQLLSFEEVRTRLRLREELYRGLQDIPLDAIVGSVGRYSDFTGTFLPKSAINKDRWTRIYAEAEGNMGLPPIEVYQVGEVYFVRDGNHRVSVALAMGQKSIEAYVTEVDVPFCLNKAVITKQMDAAEAYMTFLDETGLRYVNQHENLMLSEPTRYNDFIGHINLHGAVLSECAECPVSIQEAAAHWYENVYLPAVVLIRKHDMLAHMKNRTEADMYLWLVEHLHELERSYNGLVSDLTPALASFLGKHRLPVPDELVALAV